MLLLRGQLNKCMAEFMNGKLKFGELSRTKRISCTKVKFRGGGGYCLNMLVILMMINYDRFLYSKSAFDLLQKQGSHSVWPVTSLAREPIRLFS